MDEKFEERTGEYEEREDHRLKHAGAIALFLLSFIIIALICWLLSAMLRKKQGKKTVLTRTNSLLGGAFGLVKGCLFLVLVSGVSVTLAPFTVPQSATLFGINSSLVLDLPVMLVVMLILTVPALVKGKLHRAQGILLLAIYAAFCAVQFAL